MGRFASAETEEVPGIELSLKPPQASVCGVNGIHAVPDRVDSFSLDLGLGCVSRLFTSRNVYVSAGYGNVMEADLGYHPHLGNDLIHDDAVILSSAEGIHRQELDLTLSLSTGPQKSVITNSVSTFSPQLQRNTDISATSCNPTVQLIDEGSTSGKWSVEPLGPPLSVSLAPCSIGMQSSCRDILSPSSAVSTLPLLLFAKIDSVSFVAETVQKPQMAKSRICLVVGCGKGARGASGRCISHGGGRRCERPGCLKGAEGRTVFCKAHGGGRRCDHLGCTKTAEGRTDLCIAHGGGRRCTYNGCTHASRGKSGLCIRHGGGKRCQKENCTRSAEGSSGLCISHGGGRRCQKPGCTKGAQGSTMYCKGHGGGSRCTALGCTKGAEGSTQFCKGHGGGKRCSYGGSGVCPKSVHGGTLFCVRHGGGKRCATPGCTKSARGKTSHCVRHGGGKRCQLEGCTKSAQGKTDFCKAHGGGNRCTWLPSSSATNNQASNPCDKFARGKSGLCAFHSTLSKDKRVHGGDLLGPNLPDIETSPSKKMKETDGSVVSHARERSDVDDFTNNLPDSVSYSSGFELNTDVGECTVPEGRVHGGNIMKLFNGNLGSC